MSDIEYVHGGDRVMLFPAYMRDEDSALGTVLGPGRNWSYVILLDSGRVTTLNEGQFIDVTERDTLVVKEQELPMTDHTLPSETPNVIITNPTIRKWVGNILGAATVILSIATVVDGAIAEVDYANVTGPAAIIIAGILGIFQLTVTSSNVPKV